MVILPLGESFRYGCLRSLCEYDAPAMLLWMHDPGTASLFARDFMSTTEEDAMSFVRSSWASSKDTHLAVCTVDGSYQGTISLKDVDATSRSAEYAIAMLPAARGRGLAMAATRDLLSLAFRRMGLRRVYLNVRASNARAIRFYEKVGFVREGVSRQGIRSRGEGFEDLLWYSMLEEDWRGSQHCGENR